MDETYSLLTFAYQFAFFSLSVAFLTVIYRLVVGPGIVDRLVAFDFVASALIGFVLVYIIYTGETVYLNIALITGLILFMGNIAFANYLKKTLDNE